MVLIFLYTLSSISFPFSTSFPSSSRPTLSLLLHTLELCSPIATSASAKQRKPQSASKCTYVISILPYLMGYWVKYAHQYIHS